MAAAAPGSGWPGSGRRAPVAVAPGGRSPRSGTSRRGAPRTSFSGWPGRSPTSASGRRRTAAARRFPNPPNRPPSSLSLRLCAPPPGRRRSLGLPGRGHVLPIFKPAFLTGFRLLDEPPHLLLLRLELEAQGGQLGVERLAAAFEVEARPLDLLMPLR